MNAQIEDQIKLLEEEMTHNYDDFMNDLLTYEEFHWVQGQCVKKIKELKELNE
jgi:hypothetical protein